MKQKGVKFHINTGAIYDQSHFASRFFLTTARFAT
jgi:hypothetical protein